MTSSFLLMKWSEMEDDEFTPSAASKALDEICGILPPPRHPTPRRSYLPRYVRPSSIPTYATAAKSHKHKKLRCSKCHCKGHIRRDCPMWDPIVRD